MKKTLSALLLSLMTWLSASSANAAEITVENYAGKQTVPQNPQRVVVLDFGAADSIRALGSQDKIVGFPKAGAIPAYLADFKQDQFKNVGSLPEPAFEQINELDPDLIIASPRQKKLVDKLKEIAPVFYIENDYNNYYDSFKQNILALGQIFDKETLAKEKLAQVDKTVDQVAKDSKGKTALVIIVNESKISVFGEGSRYAMVYQKFGFTPADKAIKSSTHGMSVGFEYLAEKNPDYLFVVDRTAAITDKTNNAQTVLDNEIIKQMQAYKHHHIVYLNAENWYLAFGGLQSMEIMAKEIDQAAKE